MPTLFCRASKVCNPLFVLDCLPFIYLLAPFSRSFHFCGRKRGQTRLVVRPHPKLLSLFQCQSFARWFVCVYVMFSLNLLITRTTTTTTFNIRPTYRFDSSWLNKFAWLAAKCPPSPSCISLSLGRPTAFSISLTLIPVLVRSPFRSSCLICLFSAWFVVTGMQEKLGVLNGGAVYAVYDYTAQNADELNFRCGQLLWIVRRSDEAEPHWWWATDHHSHGYVPRNLLSVSIQKCLVF